MNVLQAIAARTSCRSYRTDPVPAADLERLVESVRLAPSACNRQPWRLAMVQDAAVRRRIVTEAFLPGIPMPWAMGAPVLAVIGMERSFVTHRLGTSISGVDYPWVDIGIAGEHLVLAATALGLGTCWIGWIRPARLRRIVGWPRSIKPVAVITVGLPSATEPPAEHARKPAVEIAKWI